MGLTAIVETERLILRRWTAEDSEPFARMNADPRVMEFFPRVLSRDKSNIFIDRIEEHFHHFGFGLCAVERRGEAAFIGFIGLMVPTFDAHFMPCVEIGWRLAPEHWGRGLATEGAAAMVRYAFDVLALPDLVSFTATANRRSRRIMEKLGMTHHPADDFGHPGVPARHPLRRHVLYRLAAENGAATTGSGPK